MTEQHTQEDRRRAGIRWTVIALVIIVLAFYFGMFLVLGQD